MMGIATRWGLNTLGWIIILAVISFVIWVGFNILYLGAEQFYNLLGG